MEKPLNFQMTRGLISFREGLNTVERHYRLILVTSQRRYFNGMQMEGSIGLGVGNPLI